MRRAFKFGLGGCLGIIGAFVLLIVVIVVIVALAGGGDEAKVVDSPNSGGTAATSSGSTGILDLAVGQSADVGDARVTVNSCAFSKEGVIAAKAGFRYLIVDVSVVNRGKDVYNISSLLQTEARDADGRTYNATIGPRTQGNLDGAIQPGETLRGQVAHEVPDTLAVKWQFKQAFGSQVARWNTDCQ